MGLATSSVICGARLEVASTCGGILNRVSVTQDGAAKVVRAHASPQGACENLVCVSQVVGEPADGWRQPRGLDVRRFSGAEQDENHD